MSSAVIAQSARKPLLPLGNPGELVAAESALAHMARDKGANAALANTADDAAEVLGAVRAPARVWLRTHDAAPWFDQRQTGTVWAACDGTAGISTGLWRGGWFAIAWKRQKKLNYKWLLAMAEPQAPLPPAPDWITGKLADCPPRAGRGATLPALPAAMPSGDVPAGADSRDGRSDDGSLVWRSTVLPDRARHLSVWIWQDGAFHGVFDRMTPAGG